MILIFQVVSDEDMHDSEKWLRTLGSIPTVAIKVQSMVFMSTFDVSLAGVQDNLTLVSSCIGKHIMQINSSSIEIMSRCRNYSVERGPERSSSLRTYYRKYHE